MVSQRQTRFLAIWLAAAQRLGRGWSFSIHFHLPAPEFRGLPWILSTINPPHLLHIAQGIFCATIPIILTKLACFSRVRGFVRPSAAMSKPAMCWTLRCPLCTCSMTHLYRYTQKGGWRWLQKLWMRLVNDENIDFAVCRVELRYRVIALVCRVTGADGRNTERSVCKDSMEFTDRELAWKTATTFPCGRNWLSRLPHLCRHAVSSASFSLCVPCKQLVTKHIYMVPVTATALFGALLRVTSWKVQI